jgi:glycosyltransferase involved in cell wall biosynthesis
MNETVSVVQVPVRVDSVEADWSFGDVAGQPAVRHLVARIRAGLADIPVFLLCSDNRTADLLHQVFDGSGCEVFHSTVLDKLGSLAEFCQCHAEFDTLVLFHPHSLFPDCEIAGEMLSSHREEKADATFCLARPRGYLPEIFEARAVARLKRLDLPVNMTNDFIAVMKKANRLGEQYHDSALGEFAMNQVTPDDSWPPSKVLPATLLTESGWSLRAAEAVLASGVDLGNGSLSARQMKEHVVRSRHCGPVVNSARYQLDDGRIPVLFLTARVGYSGAEESFSLTILNLDRSRFQPFVVLPLRGKLSRRLEAAGIPVEILYEDCSLPTLRNVIYCRDLLRAGNFRIIHVNGDAGMPIAVAARDLGVPIVHHVRKFYGVQRNNEWQVLPEPFAFSARNIAISDAIADNLLHHDLLPQTVVRIYNGVELERFEHAVEERDHLRQKFGLQEKRVVCMIARICEQKRQEELLQAMPFILERLPDTVALLVGEVADADFTYNSGLQDMVRRVGIEKSVVFWGFEQYIERVHAVSDVMVLCTKNEPFGRCILEAMAAGVPVVVPSRGGPTEIVGHGESGLLYNTGNPKQLADSICAVLSDSTLRDRLVRGGMDRARTFSIQWHSQCIARMYEELLVEPQKAHGELAVASYAAGAA